MFKTKYRIVTDKFNGYEVQVRKWYFPIWHQPTINTHISIEMAKEYIKNHKQRSQPVYYE